MRASGATAAALVGVLAVGLLAAAVARSRSPRTRRPERRSADGLHDVPTGAHLHSRR